MTDVVRKAATILRTLSESPETTLSLAALSDKLSMNKSTCHRILTSLADEDLVEKVGIGSYRLGIGAFVIGASVQRCLDIRERSLPAMRWLHGVSEETVYLCVRRGSRAVCLERVVGLHAEIQVLQIGGSLPLHVGAAPRVLLAGLSDADLADYLTNPNLERYTAKTLTSAMELMDDVERVRRTGAAVSRSDVAIMAKSFGVPVKDFAGSTVGALSVSGIAARIPRKREAVLVRAAMEAGARASAAMGFGPDALRPPNHQKKAQLSNNSA